jgi:hypothetical protein
LRQATFVGANLTGSVLGGASLQQTNFRYAQLNEADLYGVRASQADFSGANLTGACFQDWRASSQVRFDYAICDFAYLRRGSRDRYPANPQDIMSPEEAATFLNGLVRPGSAPPVDLPEDAAQPFPDLRGAEVPAVPTAQPPPPDLHDGQTEGMQPSSPPDHG